MWWRACNPRTSLQRLVGAHTAASVDIQNVVWDGDFPSSEMAVRLTAIG